MKLAIRYWHESGLRARWKYAGFEVQSEEDAEEIITHFGHDIDKAVLDGKEIQIS